MDDTTQANGYEVIELRRYTISSGERTHFASYFDTYFPEAFQQLDAIVLGQGLERDAAAGFTWLRGFRHLDERVRVNTAFYEGPVWREHGSTMNSRLLDHTNVLLLRVLRPTGGIVPLPAVDPGREPAGATGVVVMQVFPVNADGAAGFAHAAQPLLTACEEGGVRETALLETLDAPNEFPRLPYRVDGPYVVWLGVVADDVVWQTRTRPAVDRLVQWAGESGLLRAAPESIVLDPSPRSRLRWTGGLHQLR